MTATKLAPGHSVFHSDDRVSHGGGVFSDTTEGTEHAGRHGYKWIDCDGHLMLRTGAAKLVKKALRLDVVWVNAHGSPFNLPWQKGRKLESMVWLVEHRRHPDLRSALQTFRENKRHGLSTEWEPKDLHPLTTKRQLAAAFRKLRRAARRAYGKGWQDRVVVKVLSNLGGGLPYAKAVLQAAHAEGFDTMILPRGDHARQVISETYITWNRGGRVR